MEDEEGLLLNSADGMLLRLFCGMARPSDLEDSVLVLLCSPLVDQKPALLGLHISDSHSV